MGWIYGMNDSIDHSALFEKNVRQLRTYLAERVAIGVGGLGRVKRARHAFKEPLDRRLLKHVHQHAQRFSRLPRSVSQFVGTRQVKVPLGSRLHHVTHLFERTGLRVPWRLLFGSA